MKRMFKATLLLAIVGSVAKFAPGLIRQLREGGFSALWKGARQSDRSATPDGGEAKNGFSLERTSDPVKVPKSQSAKAPAGSSAEKVEATPEEDYDHTVASSFPASDPPANY